PRGVHGHRRAGRGARGGPPGLGGGRGGPHHRLVDEEHRHLRVSAGGRARGTCAAPSTGLGPFYQRPPTPPAGPAPSPATTPGFVPRATTPLLFPSNPAPRRTPASVETRIRRPPSGRYRRRTHGRAVRAAPGVARPRGLHPHDRLAPGPVVAPAPAGLGVLGGGRRAGRARARARAAGPARDGAAARGRRAHPPLAARPLVRPDPRGGRPLVRPGAHGGRPRPGGRDARRD